MGRIRVNDIGLDKKDYGGRESSLCKGCGHNSISNQIIAVAYELSLPPHQVIKLSGIGCSSKSPAYFLSRSHGFNALHGRMPSVATGAMMANRSLKAIGVSGDGDSGSIGFGQFKHAIRRNVPMVYIIENNGVYGLTKGQFSATSDEGLKLKYAGEQKMQPIDLTLESLASGATFVARSFAGDAKQIRELLKAALSHKGTAVLDIISPCVAFNNADTSPKSYGYGRQHEDPIHDVSYIAPATEIAIDYDPGEEKYVEMPDGSYIRLKKLEEDYDPTDREQAYNLVRRASKENLFITGLIYVQPQKETFHDIKKVHQTPLVELTDEQIRPSKEQFDEVMSSIFTA